MSAAIITQGWGAGLGIAITVATPPFPNVPALPGVPQLARSLLFPALLAPTIATPSTVSAIWQSTQSQIVWGVYDENDDLAVTADSVMDMGWRQENRIGNFPIQQGQFATYNRVGLPYECSIVLTKGGTLADRTTFLQEVDAVIAQSNIALYTVRTPEKTYKNMSATRAELARRGTENHAYFDVELFFIQINPVPVQYGQATTSTDLSNSSVPSAVPTTNQALSLPTTPSPQISTAAAQALANPNDEVAFLKWLAQ
jgi:hypothetical protein